MDRNQATKIWEFLVHPYILKKYTGQIINDGTTAPTNFHTWVDGNKQTIGIVKLTHSETSDTLFFVILHWSKDRQYYLLIFPENKSTVFAEIGQYEKDARGIDCLHWQYSPAKRDGKNSERKKYFEESFGTTNVIINLPESREEPEEVCRFINKLFVIAATRSRADSLDQSASSSQKPPTELSRRQNSEEAIRLVFEQFYPNPDERRTCATLLADSIVYADTLSRVAWEVTLRQNNVIRLNVGTIEILALSPEKMYMVLAGELLNEIERQKFSNMLKFSTCAISI